MILAPHLAAVSFAARLDAILRDPALRGASVGAIVTDSSGRVLYARDADRRMTPASNQKLFTVAFAFDRLGPGYRAATWFRKIGDETRIESDGTLDLSYARLKEIADRIGPSPRVFLRQSYRRGRPLDWTIGDAPNRYAPAIAAFVAEKGGLELWAKDGAPELRPAPFGATVVRRVEPGFGYDPFTGVVSVGPLASGERRLDTLSQPDPDLAAARLFGETVTREVGRTSLPNVGDTVVFSPTIAEIAPKCLQPSDNFLAESLFEMARTRGVEPTTWARERVGLREGEYAPRDGSGLANENDVSPAAIAKLLRWARRQPWGASYVSALASPGVGTLRTRLAGVPFRGKTGSLSGVSALSGYVEWKRSSPPSPLVVSIIVNHYAASTARIRAVEDDFVRAVARGADLL